MNLFVQNGGLLNRSKGNIVLCTFPQSLNLKLNIVICMIVIPENLIVLKKTKGFFVK